MTFRERLVVQLILLVARIICDDEAIAKELKNVATHVAVHGKAAA